jgi:putative two-component system response regulator
MLTNVQGIENEIAGIASGADEFLLKPLHPAVVRTRIRAMLRNKAAIDSLEEAETILFALAQAVEQRDRYTGGHCQRLAALSVALGEALGLPRHNLLALHRGGYLHDIGKISIPDAILFKKGRLTDEEWEVMRSHTLLGEQICLPMKSLAPVLPIIRSHHERWDGSGYPDGLRGEQIPLLARILQVVDIYDALTTARSYKPAYTHDQALAILDEEVRRGWRDPELVSIFPQVFAESALDEPEQIPPELPEVRTMQLSLENMRRQLVK